MKTKNESYVKMVPTTYLKNVFGEFELSTVIKTLDECNTCNNGNSVLIDDEDMLLWFLHEEWVLCYRGYSNVIGSELLEDEFETIIDNLCNVCIMHD